MLLNVTLNNIERGEENGHLFSDGLHFCLDAGKRMKMLFSLYSPTSRKRNLVPRAFPSKNGWGVHSKFNTGGGRRLQESNRKGVASEKRSWHIYFIEDNLFRAMSKLGYV